MLFAAAHESENGPSEKCPHASSRSGQWGNPLQNPFAAGGHTFQRPPKRSTSPGAGTMSTWSDSFSGPPSPFKKVCLTKSSNELIFARILLRRHFRVFATQSGVLDLLTLSSSHFDPKLSSAREHHFATPHFLGFASWHVILCERYWPY